MLRVLLVLFFGSLLTACGSGSGNQNTETVDGPPSNAQLIEMAHAETFKLYKRDGYHILDLSAPVVSWGGDAKGENTTARVVIVHKDAELPDMTGDLADAVLVRTPVERIAVNYGFIEAMLTELGIEDRLVAVGGVKSYNDKIRAKARAGEIAQIGYGWHAPPSIDTLIGAEPDVLFMVLGDLGHAEHYERIKALDVPVIPIFLEVEPSYMGGVDYVRLMGILTGREAEAEAFAHMVEDNVANLRASVADREPKKALNAWYAGSGRWMVTVRNAENQLLQDAGGLNPMSREDDIRLDDFMRLSSETLLDEARDVDCWIIRDSHAQAFTDTGYLENFKAWHDGCLFASDASSKPEADAFDIYERGHIRPDLILADLIGMLHPDLAPPQFTYVQPDLETPRP